MTTIAPSIAETTVPTTEPAKLPTIEPTTAPATIPPTGSTTPLSRNEITDELLEYYHEVLNSRGTPETADVHLNIPVYYEFELLVSSYGSLFDLGFDAWWYKLFSTSENFASRIMAAYPTNAIRVRADGSSYLVYDTDTGYRFYLFIDNDKESSTVGFPVLIKKNNMLSYSDFKDIQINDAITKVETVDDVTTWHKKRITARAQMGFLVSSIHYLQDGILKIDYKLSEANELIVSDITFNKDFAIKTLDGELTSHKIKDIDLPVN